MSNELKPCPFCGSDGKEENGFSPCESIMYAFCSNVNCYLHNIDVGMNAEAWNKRSQQSAPAGYVMVPVEPTQKMLTLGFRAVSIAEIEARTKMWARMLAAAPKSGQHHQRTLPIVKTCGAEGYFQAPQPVAQDGWIPISERLPEGTVLVSYTNNYNKSRIIRAKYIQKFTQESEDIDNFDAQYDEETDTYYDCEGWYEMIDNWGDYLSVAVTEGTVTHWMPLPSAPKGGDV